MNKLRGTLSIFLLAALLLLGQSSLFAQGHPQPWSLSVSPTVVYQSECYTISVGGGANMTLDTYYTSDNAGSGVIPGWPTLDGNGQAEICTDSGTPLGNYDFIQIRNTLNTDWVNLSQWWGYPRVTVVPPLQQPTGMSFDVPSGFAGVDSYTLTIANGANMSVDLIYTLNGYWYSGTIVTDSNGQYTYNLEHSIWTGPFVFYALKNSQSMYWVDLSQPVYYTIYPPHPTTLNIYPTTVQAGAGSFQVVVGNGEGITLESSVTLNGVESNPFNMISLAPYSPGSTYGAANVEVSSCVPPGQYFFQRIRNQANANLPEWLHLIFKNVTITPASPPVGPPSLSGSPSVTGATRGASGTITISGSNLCGVSLQTSWPGLSFGTLAGFQGPNQVTTTYQVAQNAGIGTASVTVQAMGGSTTFNFNITAGAPTVTSISPSVGPRGANLPVTLTGTNLDGASLSTNPAWPGLSFSNVSVNPQGTSLTATFAVAANANLGYPTIKVTTPLGNVSTTAFQIVNPSPPTITGISPAIGLRGTNVSVIISGTNLYSPSLSTTWSSNHLSFTNIVPSGNGTSIAATLVLGSSASPGYPPIRVDTPGGNATTTSFYVTDVPPAPTLTREYIYLGDRVIAVEAP